MKKIIKKYLKSKGWTKKSEIVNINFLHLMLEYALGIKRILCIVQIGANDGIIGDPIHNFLALRGKNISAIFFEPQKEAFEKLKINYKGFSHFKFINKAIGKPGTSTFYSFNKDYEEFIKLKTGKEPGTFTNSFIKEHLIKRMKKNGVIEFDKYLNEEKLEITSLFTEIGNIKIDLLQIDCEGYDDEVIYNSSIEKLCPQLINFESKNLSEDKLQKLIFFLEDSGYITTPWSKSDIIAIRQ